MSMQTVGIEYDRKQLVTKQAHRDECDINKILSRFRKGQMISHLAKGVPSFGDVSNVGDFQAAMQTVQRGEAYFRSLPANVRAEFQNDPIRFVDAFADESMSPKLEELGLVEKKAAPVPEGTEAAPAQ